MNLPGTSYRIFAMNKNGLLVFSQVHPISTASLGESDWITEDNRLKFKLDN